MEAGHDFLYLVDGDIDGDWLNADIREKLHGKSLPSTFIAAQPADSIYAPEPTIISGSSVAHAIYVSDSSDDSRQNGAGFAARFECVEATTPMRRAATRPNGLSSAVINPSSLRWREAEQACVTLLNARPRLVNQSLTLRYLLMEGHTVFGGGTDLGAAISCKDSILLAEHVRAADNTQKAVGAGVMFLDGCNATVAASIFADNHNHGLGAGVIYASAGSKVELLYTRFEDNTYERRHLSGTPESSDPILRSASAIVVDSSDISITGSDFRWNFGGNVIHASMSTLDMRYSAFVLNADKAHKVNLGSALFTAFYGRVPVEGPQRTASIPRLLAQATISLWAESIATIAHSSFYANGGYSAGALFVSNAGTVANLQHVNFMSNHADAPDVAAGAIFVSDDATVLAVDARFDTNGGASQFAAGAIYARQATVSLSDIQFTNNSADAHLTEGSMAGAGILYADSSSIRITRANCSNNVATGATATTAVNYADAFSIRQPVLMVVQDSSITPMKGPKTVAIVPGAINNIVQGGCEQNPCKPGESCTYRDYSLSCTPCSATQYSDDGLICQSCNPGQGPKLDRSGCTACVGRNASTGGLCVPCDAGLPAADKTRCKPCPLNQMVDSSGERCVCQDRFYNTTPGLLVCYDLLKDFEPEHFLQQDESDITNTECQSCLADLEQCVSCKGGVTTLKPDYALGRTAKTIRAEAPIYAGVIAPAAIFKCSMKGCLGTNESSLSQCELGYSGPLCSVCSANESYIKEGPSCIQCAAAATTTMTVHVGQEGLWN
eukprot:COSAG02_NODE_5045_length_4699_cov_7.833696_1_plen_782_part_00